MAEHRGKIPVGKGVPSESELLKPLIFPNSQRAFKIFNGALAVGRLLSTFHLLYKIRA